MTIAWKDVRVHGVVDGVGRTFKWTELKGKHIYICGHGAHIFRDGYCTVPPNTTVNFYQTYGRPMLHDRSRGPLYDLVTGTKDFEPERSFRSGQSYPNMTLFDDDEHCITDTVAMLKRRLGNNLGHMDYFMFNCNQFSGLKTYEPLPQRPVLEPIYPTATRRPLIGSQQPLQGPRMALQVPQPDKHPWSKKQILKLEEILTVLQGNTIEWTCCQDVTMERYKADIGEPPEKPEMNADGLSHRVKAGLAAMTEVSQEIASGHYPGLYEKLGNAHSEGIWARMTDGEFDGLPAKHRAAVWAGMPNGKGKKTLLDLDGGKTRPNMDGVSQPFLILRAARNGMNVRDARQKAMASRVKINDALHALQDEPQGDPFKVHRAIADLQRGLLVVDNLLQNLNRLKA